MKKFKKLYTLATLLMAGAAITACTSDDFADEGLAPQQGKTYTLSVNATKGADTRTLAESDGALTATWNTDDEVEVYLDGEKVGTLKPDKAEADALLKGTVTGVTVGDDLDLVFSSNNYSSQEGTLEYIDANCNYAKATVEVTKIEGSDVYTSNAEFVNQQSITKFTFSEEVSKVVIYNGVDEITVTPTAATETLYVAIPATVGEADFTFTATVDGKTYRGEKSATLENGKFYTATISLTALDDYIDLSAEEAANTYMVTEAGKYKFKATVKGNGGIDPITETTATPITGIAGVKVLWELKADGAPGLAIKYANEAYDIFYNDGYVYFSTPDIFTSGDAYVAVYDNEDTILWSWLIWATPEVSTIVKNGYTYMDRNLGGIDGGNYMRGFCYQWGRKDPFPAADGGYTPYNYVPERMTAFSIYKGGLADVQYTVQNPTAYIMANTMAHWITEADYRSGLWGTSQKTIYDPCPAGWKVPSKDEAVGYKNLSLPGTGFIGDCNTDFSYGNPGTGYYWTSTSTGWNQVWGFYNDGRGIVEDNHQRNGFAIRPVKEGLDVTGVEVGMVIGANGKFYADKAAAETAGTTAEAMVAYLGTEAEGAEHGLAIALEDATSSDVTWDNAKTTVSTWENNNHKAPFGEWRVPTAYDWQRMFKGCGSTATYVAELTSENNSMVFSYGNFRDKLKAAGGDSADMRSGGDFYWSGSEYGSLSAWHYSFNTQKFINCYKSSDSCVRACLAF